MKALVASACIAVIAFVGYYFWGEYEARARQVARVEAATARNKADRDEIFELANANPGETDMASAWCRLTVMRLDGGKLAGNREAARLVTNCMRFGLLSD
ncbi:hypothetical protein [Limoniibacter endophyticus]|uniref:Uncharacterized protein n=1 Tax=Limoniibacter endophyticus TaxID=1565040 RepID=A0A8J3DKP3_9HYPH|nr:hypothetical protein [Limoniibacter endophyticus]GHC61485.1 hypothetical protein GCM10010136_02050 [Limoniibacter endophyticus]